MTRINDERTIEVKVCYKCHEPVGDVEYISRGDSCPKCGFDLKCCYNCRFYDSGSYNECTEPQADRVTDKEKANFCDYFKFKEAGEGASASGKPGMPEKGNPLDALFKK